MNAFATTAAYVGGVSPEAMDTGGLGMGIFATIGLSLLFALIMYVVYAIAMSRIAENEGYDKPWLAWVPIVNTLLIPLLVEKDVVPNMRGRFTLIYVASLVVCIPLAMLVPVIGTLIGFIPSLLFYYAFYLLANRYSNQPGVHMLAVILLGSLLLPFQLFRFSSREAL